MLRNKSHHPESMFRMLLNFQTFFNFFLHFHASFITERNIMLEKKNNIKKKDFWEFSRIPPLKWYENRFIIRCSLLCIIKTPFEMCCVSVILENVLHTQNVCVRAMKNFLLASKVKVFSKNPHILSLKLCQASKYFIKLCEFLAKILALDACRKFFMAQTNPFRVSKAFS